MSQLVVSGMSCAHCVKAVTQAVHSEYPDVVVDVDLASGAVQLTGDCDIGEVRRLIEEEGYAVAA